MSKKENSKPNFIKTFVVLAVIMLLLPGLLVVLFDPFYHYHKPLFGMKAVVYKSEHQCIGTIRNFDYDSIIIGSSIAEKYNNNWFDESFGGKTIKGIKSNGTTVELTYYLGEAAKAKKLKNVYYCLDTYALEADPDEVFPNENFPEYLFDHNPCNDVEYLWNKDVLFQYIPYQIVSSKKADLDEGLSYNWIEGKVFSKEAALSHYAQPKWTENQKPADEDMDIVSTNLSKITDLVEANPDTTFRFVYSPYSILWWDEANRDGTFEHRLNIIKTSVEVLSKYDNVKVYFYMDNEDIVKNLDNYMDNVHFTMDINKYVVDEMALEQGLVTPDNIEEKLNNIRNGKYYLDDIE